MFTIAAFTLTHLLWNIADAANISLISVIAPDGPDRMHLNSRRMMGSSGGRMIASYVVPYVLIFYASLVQEQRFLYMLMAFTASVLMWGGFVIHYKLSEGYETTGTQYEARSKLSGRDIWEVLTTNKHLAAIFISDLTSNVGAILLPSLAYYYYMYVLQKPTLLPTHQLVTGLGQFVGAWLIGKVVRNPEKKKPLLLGLYFIISACMISVYFYAYDAVIFIAMQTLMNVFTGMTQPMEADLYIDTAIYHEWRTGKNALGFIVGLMALPVKLSVVIKSVIVSVAFAAIGYVKDMPVTPQLQSGLINAYVIVPTIIPLLGAVSIGLFYKLRPREVENMQREIEERNRH